jgi:DNA modification methylase
MQLKTVPIDSISQDPANLRRHGERNLDSIVASLRKFGQQHPIVIDVNGTILSGNGRYEAAKRLGWTEISVVTSALKGSDATAYAIADNRTAELAEWDSTALAETLRALQSEDYEIEAAGYNDDEINKLIEGLGDDLIGSGKEQSEIIEDEIPEPPAEPITKPGDLWILGEHRLLCGDSTNADDVARLMNGEKADMMFTDPPYGVNYEGGHFHSGDVKIKRKREKLADDDTTEIYPAFLPVALPVVDGPCYMWFAGTKARDVYNAVAENQCEVHALIIWHKTNATYAAMNAQYKQRHEPCLYFKPNGSTLRWCGATTEATVWNQDRDGINEFHPTQKPVALAAKAIRNHKVEIILDSFCGSGSTLIAAEQLGRKCYGMEISPQYCDVIVKRWEQLTGMVGVREDCLKTGK